MIERPYYIDRLKRFRGTGLVKVLTGMRRAGKSGILRLLEQALLWEGVSPASILLINLELIENAALCEASALLAHIKQHAPSQGTVYVLIDEAQESCNIGRVAYSLLEDGRFDVCLTGSHTRLVEHALADVMAGRYVEIPVFPLSFAEYRTMHSAAGMSDDQLFAQYLGNGGLPHTISLEEDPYALRDYLDGVYHTVVRRDVTAELGHEDPALLDAIARHLVGNLGSPSSANRMAQSLSSSGRSCSDDTVSRYLSALTSAYAFHRVNRYDLKSHMLLKTQEKYYVDDLGLRTLLLGPQQGNLAGMLENVVYLELRRRFKDVHVGKHYARTICFVAQGPQGREYFMVEPSVLDQATLARALKPLQAERDNYPKTILTLDRIGTGSHDGIRQRNLIEWLLAADSGDGDVCPR
ncbi:MAG: ATP-binding protein [Coriobacteriales bacterium]|nr:ATP-binding protein [Coriobacteriales bacterium]